MRIKKIKIIKQISLCSSGICPSVYLTNNNTILVQGTKINPNLKTKLLKNLDEDIIEIPLELFKKANIEL